jgi:hypothetical protein
MNICFPSAVVCHLISNLTVSVNATRLIAHAAVNTSSNCQANSAWIGVYASTPPARAGLLTFEHQGCEQFEDEKTVTEEG